MILLYSTFLSKDLTYTAAPFPFNLNNPVKIGQITQEFGTASILPSTNPVL